MRVHVRHVVISVGVIWRFGVAVSAVASPHPFSTLVRVAAMAPCVWTLHVLPALS